MAGAGGHVGQFFPAMPVRGLGRTVVRPAAWADGIEATLDMMFVGF